MITARQQSFGMVMLSQLSLSPRGGCGISDSMSFLWMDMSRDGYVWGWVRFWGGLGVSGRVWFSGGWVYPEGWVLTPLDMGYNGCSRQAGGMHPTGMLSCLNQWTLCIDICNEVNSDKRLMVHSTPDDTERTCWLKNGSWFSNIRNSLLN